MDSPPLETAFGVYRLWRDGGYAVGALASSLPADVWGIPSAIAAVAGLMFLSGLVVATVMYETLPARRIDTPCSSTIFDRRGATWTTDAPFREMGDAIAFAHSEAILGVEMEAALYALAQVKSWDIICFAHVTNRMGSVQNDFEKGAARAVPVPWN